MRVLPSFALLPLFAAGVAQASPVVYIGTLSGAAESPANASPGSGSTTVTVDIQAQTMALSINFAGLSGTTTASHIHCCTATAGASTAGVATTTPNFAGFPLGVSSGTYTNTLDMTQASSYSPAFVTASGGTTAGAFAALLTGLADGKAYLNIHSSTFGGGEIRSFLKEVPLFANSFELPPAP